MLRKKLVIVLLIAFSNAASADPIEYISPQEYTAAKIAQLKGAGGDLQSQLGLASMYADNSAGFQDVEQSAKVYEKAFFRGSLEQIVGARADKIGHMQMWWHINTYTKILKQRPDADYNFKSAYMNALLLCNDENDVNYYEALRYANLAQSYNTNVNYVQRAQKLVKFLLARIRQEESQRNRNRRY